MSVLDLNIILIVTGILAGIVSTAAGLASLVSYPVLLALGLPPVTANVTNTLGLLFTSIGAVASSQKELHGHARSLRVILPLTLLGSILGALLLFIIFLSCLFCFQYILYYLFCQYFYYLIYIYYYYLLFIIII